MIRIGLTGTLGAGKTSVGDLFERWGARRIDADTLARQAVEPGSPGLAAVRREFGETVMRPDGRLDRAALRAIVFADPDALRRLEAIVHPEVDRLRAGLLEEARADGAAVIVLEIPLLLEKGLAPEFDAVIVVDAPVAVRRRRVRESRGITAEEFTAMDGAQWGGERKRAAADFTIWNDGDRAELETAARGAWDAVTGASAAWEGRGVDPPVVWRVDLHTHTHASADCLSAPSRVVARAREAGLDRIAITDHDEIDGAFEARDIDPALVIVGEEVRTAEGLDLIGLFLTDRIAPGGSFRDVAGEIRRQGGVVYVPHPFDAHRGTTPNFLAGVVDCIDAVEAFNARVHDRRRNERAREWAAEHGLPVGAGSDSHLLREIGRATTVLAPFADAAGFLRSLAGSRLEGRVSSRLVHLGSTWAKLVKRDGPAPRRGRQADHAHP